MSHALSSMITATVPIRLPVPAPRWTFVRILSLAVVAAVVGGCDVLLDPATRGQRALQDGDYRSALRAYNEAIERGSVDPIVFANRCIIHDELGNSEEAVGDCTRSLELADELDGPIVGYDRRQVLNNRGVAYLGMRRYDDAVADFDAAIELDEEYADAYANRGRLRMDTELYDDAIADFDRAIELDEDLVEAYGNRGLAYQYLGDDESAMADFTRATEINHSAEAYYNRAALNYTLGRFDEAFEDYNLVLEHGDTGSYIYYIAQTQADFLANRPSREEIQATQEAFEEEMGSGSDDDG